MKRYLILMTAATLVAACSNDANFDNEGYEPSNKAIAFDASEEGATTRAIGMIDSNQDLQALTQGFGVFGSYTGRLTYENTTVSPDFMYNQQVKYENGVWTYSPVKYWPNNSTDYVSFFAYAPYEATPKDDGRCIIDMSKRYDLGDPWINYRLAEDPWSTTNPQVDLLYGQHEDNTNYTSWLDQQKPTDPINYKLTFTFRHALACIGDEITIKCASDLTDLIDGYITKIQITNVTINYQNLTTKGRLVLNSIGSANWKEIISGELTTTRTYTKDLTDNPIIFDPNNFTDEQTISTGDGDGLFYIPLRIAGTDAAKAEVTIAYTVTNNENHSYSGTATTSFELDMSTEGQKQGIALQLTKDFDLQHLVYVIGRGANNPSYSKKR